MSKFIITFDAGYGEEYGIVDAQTRDKATELAHQAWLELAESNAIYCAETYSDELAEELGLDPVEE